MKLVSINSDGIDTVYTVTTDSGLTIVVTDKMESPTKVMQHFTMNGVLLDPSNRLAIQVSDFLDRTLS